MGTIIIWRGTVMSFDESKATPEELREYCLRE